MRRIVLSLLFLLACLTPAAAQNCGALPYTLTNGTTADANQVMANFNSLLSCANSNLAHSGTNTDITSISSSPIINNTHANTYVAAGLTNSMSLTSVGSAYYLVSATYSGVYNNTNGTPCTVIPLVTVKDGAGTVTSTAYTATLATGYATFVTFSFNWVLAQPVANAFTVVMSDTEIDGCSHSWTTGHLSGSASGVAPP